MHIFFTTYSLSKQIKPFFNVWTCHGTNNFQIISEIAFNWRENTWLISYNWTVNYFETHQLSAVHDFMANSKSYWKVLYCLMNNYSAKVIEISIEMIVDLIKNIKYQL